MCGESESRKTRRPELLDDLGHPAVMVGVVMADDDQVDRGDPPVSEQFGDD